MDPQGSKNSSISSTNFDQFSTQLQSSALKATRNALAIPSDLAFHRSVDPEFASDLDALSSKVLALTNEILALVSTADGSKSTRTKGKSKLKNQEDIVDNFSSLVVDSVDQLFERVVSLLFIADKQPRKPFSTQDTCLDQYLGRTKPPAIALNPPKTVPKVSRGRANVTPPG